MIAVADEWAQYKLEIEARLDFNGVFRDIEQAKPSGDGYRTGRCPFHDDHRPSFGFSVRTGAWECFAGCGKGDAFEYLVRRSNRSFKEVLLELGDSLGMPRPGANGRVARAIYRYRDESGAELFQVVRDAGKKFWQRRPDGSGGFTAGITGVRRVPYRLPELLARPAEPVFIVEGEKDVDRLLGKGLLSTTNPGGAGKWRDEYSPFLRGREVIIVPDNDAPGREHATQVARSLHGVAGSVRLVELPDLPEKGDVSDWLAAGRTVKELQDLVMRAETWTFDSVVARRPVILISDRQLRDVIEDTWTGLLAGNAPPHLFVTAGQLSRLSMADGDPVIEHLDEPSAYGILVRLIDWTAQRKETTVNARPPKDLARDILANPHPDLPRLEAVISSPVYDAAGQLVRSPGYHPQARVWLHRSAGDAQLEVPDQPTELDVAEALDLLCGDLLVDFPFTAQSDQAHALAAFVLPFIRRMIAGPTPIHLIEAPTPGSGKSLLADLVSIVARGRACEATTLTRDENEARKKITALLSRGMAIVLVDNVRKEFDSAQLASALTAEVWSDRILGQTRMVELPNRATWLVTANNPKLSLDIARRSVRIRIDTHAERPWERGGFKHDPIREWALRERPRLMGALLVLVQNWIAHGRPAGSRKLGSFEPWAQTIGGILDCAGVRGFLEDTDEFYAAADADGQEWRVFINVWAAAYGTGSVTAGALVKLAEQHELLVGVIGDKGPASQRVRLAQALQQLRDRQFGEYRIVTERDEHAKASRYRLEAAFPVLLPLAELGGGSLREVAGGWMTVPAAAPAMELTMLQGLTNDAGSCG